MKWEGLNLHIENLVPGVVTLLVLLAMCPQSAIETWSESPAHALTSNAFVGAMVFVATSYLLGIFVVAVCRAVIDELSPRFVRPLVFGLCNKRFRGKSPTEVRDLYRDSVSNALESDSEYKRTEVKNRRERTRLLRSAILPALLFTWTVSQDSALVFRVLYEILLFGAGLLLYAYSEYTIYIEAGYAPKTTDDSTT